MSEFNTETLTTNPEFKVDTGKCKHCGMEADKERLCRTTDGKNMVKAARHDGWIECHDTIACKRRVREKSNADDLGVKSTAPWTKEDVTSQFNKASSQLDTTNKYTQPVVYQKCRHEASPAFDLAGITFHGGSRMRVTEQTFDDEWMVVCLLGKNHLVLSPRHTVWSIDKQWEEYLQEDGAGFKVNVAIDWPDMGAPPVKYGFWKRLVALAATNHIKNVLFYCEGGHGRTGTALASVLIECAGRDVATATKTVHTNYCTHAIESDSQRNYLKDLQRRTGFAKAAAKTTKGDE